MTQQDYDQKKRECFVQFCKDNGIDQEVNISIFDAFDQIFDRAYAFGKKIGNSDFSDAEEEGILTVPRKDIVELFQEVQKTISRCKGTALAVQPVGIKDVLWSFFGSKCLPDNVESSEPNVESLGSNVDSLPQNPTENCDTEYHISTGCDKPDEPKYHPGQKVRYNGYVYEVEGLVGKNRYALKGLNFDLDEDMIEPYTEPTEHILQPFCQVLEGAASTEPTDFGKEVNFPTKKQSRNLSQETANCDKQFDNILKGCFLKEQRLNVATRVLCGMMADPVSSNIQGKPTPVIVKWAYEIADALIAEAEKGAER